MCPNFMVTATFPSIKQPEAVKYYLKYGRTAFRNAKIVGKSPYNAPSSSGTKVYWIFEVEDSRLGEALREIAVFFNTAATTIDGYVWQFEVIVGIDEAIAMAGQQPSTK